MDRIKSEYFLRYFRKNSMRAPQTAVKTNAPMTGFCCTNRLNDIPAKEAWDSVSPIIEYLLTTKKIPIQGHKIPIKIDTISAFCINSYCNIVVFLPYF